MFDSRHEAFPPLCPRSRFHNDRSPNEGAVPRCSGGTRQRASAYDDDVRQSLSGQFLRHRSQVAREAAIRNLEIAVQRVASLVLNASSLADRLEAMPSTDLDKARDRKARVKVLRDAASAGQAAIERSTAHLAGEPVAEVDSDSAGWREPPSPVRDRPAPASSRTRRQLRGGPA